MDQISPKLQRQIEEIATKTATALYNKMSKKGQYDLNKIITHTHNGVDSVRIAQKDVELNTNYIASVLATTTDVTTFTRFPPNMERMIFSGYAVNGGVTKVGSCNGEVNFGTTYNFIDTSFNTVGLAKPFTQSCNSIFIDKTSLANTNVSSSGLHLFYVADETGTPRATMEVTYYDGQVLKLSVVVDTGWQISGVLTIT